MEGSHSWWSHVFVLDRAHILYNLLCGFAQGRADARILCLQSVDRDARAKDSASHLRSLLLLSGPLKSPPFCPLFYVLGVLEEAAGEVGKEFKKYKLTDPLDSGPV